jgi:hypothetical protein
MKKNLLTLTILIFLEACRTTPSPPLEFIGRQCQPVFSFDTGGEIDTRESFCRCRDYKISKEFIGSLGNVSRRPLGECDQFNGYSIRDNARLVNFMESVRSEIVAGEDESEKGIIGEAEEPAYPSGD